MAPKTDKNILVEVKAIYQSGAFKSVTELADRYGINHHTLRNRIRNERWNVKREELLAKVDQKVEEQAVSKVDEYLSRTSLRMQKYEKIIDASIENLGSKTPDGVPLLDPEAIDQFTRSEARIRDISAFALRIPTMSQTDITTNGQSLGASLVSAIAKLRETGQAQRITPEEHARILSLEVEPKQ